MGTRTDVKRERDDLAGRLDEVTGRERSALQRLDEQATAHVAELGQLRTDAARERDELRQALDDRAPGVRGVPKRDAGPGRTGRTGPRPAARRGRRRWGHPAGETAPQRARARNGGIEQ